MAYGPPIITTEATAEPGILTEECGRIVSSGSIEDILHALRWYSDHRDELPAMRRAARIKAEAHNWALYRNRVSEGVRRIL